MKKRLLDFEMSKREGGVLTWLTCYDFSFASALNETDLDLILVGDSGGMVLLGYNDTSPVSMDEMLMMCSAVRRGAPDKFLVGDMPRGSYESSNELAVESAMKFAKISGADAVKLEGGARMANRIEAVVSSGIPTIGHIGLTPQSLSTFGGYRVTGKSEKETDMILSDALALQSAGACAILLEAMPEESGARIAQELRIPVFGIGAGAKVDGQLVILHDLIGLYPNFRPKFAKNYVPEVIEEFKRRIMSVTDLLKYGRETRRDGVFELCKLAVDKFIVEARSRSFPSADYVYTSIKHKRQA